MVKKIKTHKDVKLPFGSGKTDTRPWVPREKAGKGGSPGQPYDDPEKGKGPFVPAPGKIAKKKKSKGMYGEAFDNKYA